MVWSILIYMRSDLLLNLKIRSSCLRWRREPFGSLWVVHRHSDDTDSVCLSLLRQVTELDSTSTLNVLNRLYLVTTVNLPKMFLFYSVKYLIWFLWELSHITRTQKDEVQRSDTHNLWNLLNQTVQICHPPFFKIQFFFFGSMGEVTEDSHLTFSNKCFCKNDPYQLWSTGEGSLLSNGHLI